MLMKLTVTIKKNGQISYVLHKHAYKERRRKIENKYLFAIENSLTYSNNAHFNSMTIKTSVKSGSKMC